MHSVSRAQVQAFYQAYATRDPARIAPFLDDDVHWTISGPIDVLRFCGERRGKAEVLDLFDRPVPIVFSVIGLDPEALLIEGDRAAMLATLSGVKDECQRKIRYQVAQFLRFRDGKLVEFRCIIDSFDAAEQILGHAIDLSRSNTGADRVGTGNLIAV
jgi:ketosteroid isomerase-like protein